MSGLGRRRRVHRRIGRGILSDIIGSIGLGRRRRVHRRRTHRRGRGILDVLKAVHPFVKRSGVLGHLAGMIPGIGGIAGTSARALGYGRRRRVHRRRRVGGRPRMSLARRLMSAMGRRRRRPTVALNENAIRLNTLSLVSALQASNES